MEPITFLASFPAIQSAIKRSGDGGGMRIQLDIPESEMANAVHLLALTNVVLRVTVEVKPSDATQHRKRGTKTNDYDLPDAQVDS